MTKKQILRLPTVQRFFREINECKSFGVIEYVAMDGCFFSETTSANPTNPRYTVKPFFVANNADNDAIINWLETTFGFDFVTGIVDTNRAPRPTGANHQTFKVVIDQDDDEIDIDDITQVIPRIVWRNKVVTGGAYTLVAADMPTCKAAGTLTVSKNVGDVLPVGKTVITATFTPTDTVKYSATTRSVVFNVKG